MILSAETLRRIKPVSPFCERTVQRGMSYGVSLAGYDVRVSLPTTRLMAAGQVVLVSTLERFTMPNNVVGIVHNKSTWARRGLFVPSVVLEPGWCGHLTLALHNSGRESLPIFDLDPIAQVVFHELDANPGTGYNGKYQDQGPEPTPARNE